MCVVFYCEFSSKRGPSALRALRAFDRQANLDHYPALHFSEVYLLEGGYKAFFNHCRSQLDPLCSERILSTVLCEPDNYVLMTDKKHAAELKAITKSRTKLKRSRSRTSMTAHLDRPAVAACPILSPTPQVTGASRTLAMLPPSEPSQDMSSTREPPARPYNARLNLQRHRGFSFAGQIPSSMQASFAASPPSTGGMTRLFPLPSDLQSPEDSNHGAENHPNAEEQDDSTTPCAAHTPVGPSAQSRMFPQTPDG
jgi:hypothetical protein